MSTTPLSSVGATDNRMDPDNDSGVKPYHSVPEPVEDSTISEKSMDRHIDAALQKFAPNLFDQDGNEKTEAPAPRKSLDEHVSEGLDRHEKAAAEVESFQESKQWRDELQSRYGEQGDIRQTLRQYLAFADEFRKDPVAAGQQFANSYMRASKYALTPFSPKKIAETQVDAGGTRNSSQRMSDLINDAYDNATNEKQAFVATKAEREQLRSLFPGKSFAEAMRTIVQIDRDAFLDPLGTAATLAANFGMPVLPNDIAAQQERDVAVAHVTEAAKHLPHMNRPDVRATMAHLVENNPHLHHLPTHEQLNIAYQEAVRMVAQDEQMLRGGVDRSLAQFDKLAQTHPAYAKAVEHTLTKDKKFYDHVKNIRDPELRWSAALSWTAARATGASVAKARRAVPIKSSTGANPGGGRKGRGLDAAISSAMASYKE